MNKQKECNCHPDSCSSNCNESDSVVVHLYQEIENLKRQVAERDYHIVLMETSVMNHAKEYPNGEFQTLQETLRFWQEKYERLAESHRKLQKVNQGLEDKLLRIVDKFESEKTTLTRDIADLTNKLVEARVTINEIEEENEHYKNDCTIAVNLLQCKPSNFVSYKVNSLPTDLQEKIRAHYSNSSLGKRRSLSIGSGLSNSSTVKSGSETGNGNGATVSRGNGKIIRVPISTFPPTAMVYSVNNMENETNNKESSQAPSGPDYVSAAIMAKILEERSKERLLKSGSRYQKCHQCRKRCVIAPYYDTATQTPNEVVTAADWTAYPCDADYENVNCLGSSNIIPEDKNCNNSESNEIHHESYSSPSRVFPSDYHSFNGTTSNCYYQGDQSANSTCSSNNHLGSNNYSSNNVFHSNSTSSSSSSVSTATKVKSSIKSFSNGTIII